MRHTGYTPGPWEIKGYSVFMGNGPNASGANLTKFGALGETEFWANARLIADAPRLAEENERLRELLRRAAKSIAMSNDFTTEKGRAAKYLRDEIRAALGREEDSK